MSEKRNDYIQIRVTTYEKNKIRGLAKVYAGGDMSLWLRYAGLNAERKYLIYSEYEIKNDSKDCPTYRKYQTKKAAKVQTKAALKKCKTR